NRIYFIHSNNSLGIEARVCIDFRQKTPQSHRPTHAGKDEGAKSAGDFGARGTRGEPTTMKVTTKALFASSLLFISVILVGCKGLGSGSGTGSGSSSTGSSFTVGGTVTGLAGSGLVLQNNGGDNLAVTGTGTVSFTFKTAVAKNGAYAVTVSTQPTNPTQA